MSQISLSYVEAPWGQVHLAEAGVGRGAPVVCLHQTPRSWDEFREVLTLLGETNHVIAIDTPGMGGSDPNDSIGASIENYAEAVPVVIRALDLGQVHLVGHHTGGVIALDAAARNHELIASLTLSSTAWVDEPARQARLERGRTVDDVDGWDDGTYAAALWEGRRGFYPEGRPDLLRRFLRDALRVADPAEGHRAVGEYRMEDAVAELPSIPTLLVGHGRDPHAIGHLEPMAQRLPDAEVVVIDQGMVPLEFTAPEFVDILRRFLTA